MLQRIAVVDHSFHQTTASTKFISDLLAKHYKVKLLWDTSWQGKPNITVSQLNSGHYDMIVFVQTILPIPELRQLNSQLVWLPMYDGVPIENSGYWLELSTVPLKIVSFSTTLARILERWKIECLPVQFYFNPNNFPQVTDYSSLRIFFWQRTDITFTQVQKLFVNLPIERWLLKVNPDPNHAASIPTPADCTRYNITVIQSGYGSKNDYLELLQQCNIFICPRTYEGIGMSFLEAIAMGMVPVALDHPTMNEYIEHNRTGLLARNFQPLPAFDLSALGHNIRSIGQQRYDRWQQDCAAIVPWLEQTHKPPRTLTISLRLRIQLGYYLYYCRLLWRKLIR